MAQLETSGLGRAGGKGSERKRVSKSSGNGNEQSSKGKISQSMAANRETRTRKTRAHKELLKDWVGLTTPSSGMAIRAIRAITN